MGTADKAKAREAQFDAAVEAMLLDPSTVISVPDELQRQIQDEGIDPPKALRFLVLTTRRQGDITDAVMRRFHQDLQDPQLLSDDRIMELAVAKSSWSAAQDARIAELQQTTTGQMATLYQEGTLRSDSWSEEVEQKSERLFATVRESAELSDELKDEIEARYRRWLFYTPERKPDYTALYAEALGVAEYNPDKDLSWLLDQVPTIEGITLLEEVQDLTEKIQQYLELRQQRFELDMLVRRRTEIFSNSVESRQRNAAQMARVYFTSERVVDGKSGGKLSASFDALYDYPPDAIRWLVEEQFFFHNNIPRSAREYLDAFGFQTADRKVETQEPTATSDGLIEPSGESPVPPQSNSDSPVAEEMAVSSSA